MSADKKVTPIHKDPLGAPPRHLSPAAKKCFRKIVQEAPEGVLSESDLFSVELLAYLRSIFETDPVNFGVSRMSVMMRLTDLLLMTPKSRLRAGKIPTKKTKRAENPFDKFLSREQRRAKSEEDTY